jgi:hypothetical protein
MEKVQHSAQKAKQALAGHNNDAPKQPLSQQGGSGGGSADPDAGLQSKDPGAKEAAPQGEVDALKEPAG